MRYFIALFALAMLCLTLFVQPYNGYAQTVPGVYLPLISNVVPTATPTAIPLSQGLEVKSSRIFTRQTSKFTFVAGEVLNTTSAPAYLINLHAKYFDAAHNLLGSDSGYLDTGMILPGHVSPFKLRFLKSDGIVTDYEASFSYQGQTTTDFRELTVVSKQARDNAGVEVFGEIQNGTNINIQYPVIVATFYDASGHVLDTARNETDADIVIAPGQKYAYTIDFGYTFSYSSFTVQAQGYLKK